MEWVVKRSSRSQPQSGEAVLRLRGLPFGCSKEEIAQFFSGKKIHFVKSIIIHIFGKSWIHISIGMGKICLSFRIKVCKIALIYMMMDKFNLTLFHL
jgi:hypothetical protein